jgi:tripartite-type tricarboxylate transporter receptor subunit TctC
MSKSRLAKTLCSLVLAAPLAAAAQGAADSYPSRPVTVIIPFAAGGPTDNEGRIYTNKLAETLGQAFVFDFKPGAGNRVGTQTLIKAPADGYTLMFTAATLSVIPLMYSDLPYDLYKVVAPVSLVSKRYSVLVGHPAVPYKNIKEYVAYAKANPGKINMATSGVGGSQHLTNVWLNSITGTDTTQVHYKGTAPILTDLMAGRVDVYFGTLLTVLPHFKSGKLRPVAQASLERNPALGDLPTIAESGYPGFEYSSWLGLLAPAGTPEVIRYKLAAELNKVIKMPDIVKRMGTDIQLIASTPAEFQRYYMSEHERWKKLVKEANIAFK